MKWWFDENNMNMNTYFILFKHTYWSFDLINKHTQNQHYHTNIQWLNSDNSTLNKSVKSACVADSMKELKF